VFLVRKAAAREPRTRPVNGSLLTNPEHDRYMRCSTGLGRSVQVPHMASRYHCCQARDYTSLFVTTQLDKETDRKRGKPGENSEFCSVHEEIIQGVNIIT